MCVHEDPHAHQDLRPFDGLAQSGIAVAGPPPRVLVRECHQGLGSKLGISREQRGPGIGRWEMLVALMTGMEGLDEDRGPMSGGRWTVGGGRRRATDEDSHLGTRPRPVVLSSCAIQRHSQDA